VTNLDIGVCHTGNQHSGPCWSQRHRQKVYSFLTRSARVSFSSSDLASFDDLCIQADENLFNKVLHNPDRVRFCIASCRPSLIITTLDNAVMTDHCPND